MPIFRMPEGLGLFVDVPRAGGDAVTAYLAARFGPLAFHDPRHTQATPGRRWSRSSPQHVDATSLKKLFPPDFFAVRFALVCHPAERIARVYSFQKEVEGLIPRNIGFGAWLEDLAERNEEELYLFDNSVRPMSDLVPDGTKIFRREAGTAPILSWLDGVTGTIASNLSLDLDPGSPVVLPAPYDLDRIAEIYAADYRRFDYDSRPEARQEYAGQAVRQRR